MRSNMLQVVMTVLAILFSMALALTVALICFSYSERGDGSDTTASTPEDETESTLDLPPVSTPSLDESASTPPEETETPPTEETPPTLCGNGLSFATNGDGTCALIGIGKCDDACIVIPETSPAGDLVTSVAPKAFYGCSFATAIQIPATVTHIGSLAFASCPSLVYLSVDLANPYYCDIDGILYTADGHTLLTYPSMRAGSEITIGSITTEIAEMAFYNCAYLKHITYTGSAEQWERLRIGAGNYSLIAASKSFYEEK